MFLFLNQGAAQVKKKKAARAPKPATVIAEIVICVKIKNRIIRLEKTFFVADISPILSEILLL